MGMPIQSHFNLNYKKENTMKSSTPSIEQMRYDMCVLHRSPELWAMFRKAYKTYMGAEALNGKMSDAAIGAQPRFFQEFYQNKEVAYLDMYKVWLDVTRYPRNKRERV